MARVKANGIEIEYETAGARAIPRCCWSWAWARSSPSGPTLFRRAWRKQGFYVIRFDNRDTGLSTDFGSWGLPDIAGGDPEG